jgi:acyl dehydratase
MTGKYYEDLQVGAHIHHPTGRTVTEMDNVLFCALTMNNQPLHMNADQAASTIFGQRIVNGIFTLGLVVGLTVTELTEGTIIANLGYENIIYPNPVFHGDTLYVETEVIDKRESRSRPDSGIVWLKHTGRKPDGTIVIEVERTVLFHKRPAPALHGEVETGINGISGSET